MKFLITMMAAVGGFSAAVGAEPPMMGWSTWNAFNMDISEEIVGRQAEALAEKGLADCGYRYVCMDDGWFEGREADGRPRFHPKRFPNGFKPLLKRIRALGLRPGIYSDAGENTCGGLGDAGKGVGFFGHEDGDAAFYFKEHDFDYIKLDFCGGLASGNAGGTNMSARARYTAIHSPVASRSVRTSRSPATDARWRRSGTETCWNSRR